ncbi:CRISPR-associated endonuclease Cas2 [Desulfurobacterium thermolithotrophum]|uniref:CRISPR-associated endonuclease Cas2 n=1 Tax=Desulfurobacterium thermolithotrophum TaxID=64160 RepID=UPI0013D27D99|nr:CRISPR-associated endonuclease Cas2 [Desulfurobacterium thermolithotrophum]
MFVIVTYDVDVKRVNKVRKILRKYLNWVQNSVFEGEINISNLTRCKTELKEIIKDNDSIYFYELKNPYVFRKRVLGTEKSLFDEFL